MKLTEEQLNQLKATYALGIGLVELCKKYNLDHTAILRKAKLEKWPSNLEDFTKAETAIVVREEEKEENPPSPAPPIDPGEEYLKRMGNIILNLVKHIEELPQEEVLQNMAKIEKLDFVARRTFKLDEEMSNQSININILSQNLEKYANSPKIIEGNFTEVKVLEN